ncbi:hypothetical protein PIB30_046763 [Stylosanthes scabra]|uniref:Uncharacterized protein n=1 Tax=Stylosanthes scabra TaxID=79078 RepID=A0ABU6WGG4_9FABA|nr:hypothetical protein [Stylosanthes scabra]
MSTQMPPPLSHPPRPPSCTPPGPSGASTDTDSDGDDEDEEASIVSDNRPLLRWDRHDCTLGSHRHLVGRVKEGFQVHKGEADKMRDAWLVRASKRLRELLHGICEKGYSSQWVPDDIFKRPKDYWASDEYQALKRTNKANRASSTGRSLYTGGSVTYPTTTEKMSQELGRTPSQSEVFTRTHIKKNDRGQRVDKRAEESNVSLMIVGGRKRGEVYGRGKVLSRLKSPAYDSDDVSTTSGPVDMREQVTLLNRELTQQAEQHRQEIEALHEEHASALTYLQSSFDSQLTEFDKWKSTVSQMYNFMQNMQAGTTSSTVVTIFDASTAASATASAWIFECDRVAYTGCR